MTFRNQTILQFDSAQPRHLQIGDQAGGPVQIVRPRNSSAEAKVPGVVPQRSHQTFGCPAAPIRSSSTIEIIGIFGKRMSCRTMPARWDRRARIATLTKHPFEKDPRILYLGLESALGPPKQFHLSRRTPSASAIGTSSASDFAPILRITFPSVNLHGDFTYANFGRDLLVQKSGRDKSNDLLLTVRSKDF